MKYEIRYLTLEFKTESVIVRAANERHAEEAFRSRYMYFDILSITKL